MIHTRQTFRKSQFTANAIKYLIIVLSDVIYCVDKAITIFYSRDARSIVSPCTIFSRCILKMNSIWILHLRYLPLFRILVKSKRKDLAEIESSQTTRSQQSQHYTAKSRNGSVYSSVGFRIGALSAHCALAVCWYQCLHSTSPPVEEGLATDLYHLHLAYTIEGDKSNATAN